VLKHVIFLDLQFALLLGGTTVGGSALPPSLKLDYVTSAVGSDIIDLPGVTSEPGTGGDNSSQGLPTSDDPPPPSLRRSSSMTQTSAATMTSEAVMTSSSVTAIRALTTQQSLLLETSPLQLEILDNEIKNLQESESLQQNYLLPMDEKRLILIYIVYRRQVLNKLIDLRSKLSLGIPRDTY
jgi:hypothetical protein